MGFAELLAAFPNTDRIIGKEPDRFAQHLLKIGSILYYFKEKQFAFVIDTIQRKIKTNADKQYISTLLSKLNDSVNTITIEEMINAFDKERIVRKDDRFDEYIEKYKDVYEKLKTLPSAQIISYFTYYNSFSPYSTQHGIKRNSIMCLL